MEGKIKWKEITSISISMRMTIHIPTLMDIPMMGKSTAMSIPTPMPTSIFMSIFINTATEGSVFMNMTTPESTASMCMSINGTRKRLMSINISRYAASQK